MGEKRRMKTEVGRMKVNAHLKQEGIRILYINVYRFISLHSGIWLSCTDGFAIW